MQIRGTPLLAACLVALSGCGGDEGKGAAEGIERLDSTSIEIPTNVEAAIAQCNQAAESIADEGAKQTALEICKQGVEAIEGLPER